MCKQIKCVCRKHLATLSVDDIKCIIEVVKHKAFVSWTILISHFKYQMDRIKTQFD